MPTLVMIGPCPPSRVDSPRRLDETLPGAFFCNLSGALPCLTQLGTQNGTGETSNPRFSLAETSSISVQIWENQETGFCSALNATLCPTRVLISCFPPPVPSQMTRSFPSSDAHLAVAGDLLPTFRESIAKERARLSFHLFQSSTLVPIDNLSFQRLDRHEVPLHQGVGPPTTRDTLHCRRRRRR